MQGERRIDQADVEPAWPSTLHADRVNVHVEASGLGRVGEGAHRRLMRITAGQGMLKRIGELEHPAAAKAVVE